MERFARFYMKSGNAAASYLKAGYKAASRTTLDSAASHLTRNPKVKGRIRELQKQMASRNRITVDSLLDDISEARALALRVDQPSAAIAATQLAAKLTGLLVDRKEQGQPGEFAGLQSADDVIALVASELGADSAAALAAALAKGTEQADSAPMDTTRDPDASVN